MYWFTSVLYLDYNSVYLDGISSCFWYRIYTPPLCSRPPSRVCCLSAKASYALAKIDTILSLFFSYFTSHLVPIEKLFYFCSLSDCYHIIILFLGLSSVAVIFIDSRLLLFLTNWKAMHLLYPSILSLICPYWGTRFFLVTHFWFFHFSCDQHGLEVLPFFVAILGSPVLHSS